MTVGEWLLEDPRRSIADPVYQVGKANYLVTAKDPGGAIKVYNSVGDTEAEAWDGMVEQLGLKPGHTL